MCLDRAADVVQRLGRSNRDCPRRHAARNGQGHCRRHCVNARGVGCKHRNRRRRDVGGIAEDARHGGSGNAVFRIHPRTRKRDADLTGRNADRPCKDHRVDLARAGGRDIKRAARAAASLAKQV